MELYGYTCDESLRHLSTNTLRRLWRFRYFKARYPVSDEAFYQGICRDVTERNGFQSSDVAINSCQQEEEAVRLWKWSNQIDMKVLKFSEIGANDYVKLTVCLWA
ncbi:hypothetical protein TNCV_3475411 [Trichonephila clavipes]|nr:hypothetical protein TNCV_3475411 [Trichonephila clavipes]